MQYIRSQLWISNRIIIASQPLPPSVFTDFTNLKLLDISHNPIEGILNGTFSGLYKLTKLRMVGLKPEGYVTNGRYFTHFVVLLLN